MVTPFVVARLDSSASVDLIDSVEAAELLGTNLNNLRQMVHKKKLVPLGKRGRRLLFDRLEVELVARQRQRSG